MHDDGEKRRRRERDAARRKGDAERRKRGIAALAERREAHMADAAARRKQRSTEKRERQRLRKAEDRVRREQRKAEDQEVSKERKAEGVLLKQRRKAEKIELRRQRRVAKVEQQERRRVHRAEQGDQRKLKQAAEAEAPRLKKRRWTMWFGLGFVGIGLAVLGYVGWQLWGTNWVSHQKHERIVTSVEDEWKQVGAGATLTPSGTPVVKVPEGSVSALIRIPEFGADYVVPVLEGTSDEVLAAGFGHFDDTADPGQVGNYALAAHRVTHGEPLRDMPKLEAGDEIIVETVYATYTYELTTGGEDLRVTFEDGWVVAPLPKNPRRNGVEPAQIEGQRLITLTTCAELFHTDDRLIAFGILKSKVDRP